MNLGKLTEAEKAVLFEALTTVSLPAAFASDKAAARRSMIEKQPYLTKDQAIAAREAVQRLQSDTKDLDTAVTCESLLGKIAELL